MDVLATIKQEHREVAALLDQVEGCEPGDGQLMKLAQEIQKKLSLHLAIEERLFYNKLKRNADESDDQVHMFEAYTEHEVAKQLMAMIKGKRSGDARFKAELQVLGESVKHHVAEEESTVFQLARELLEQAELDEIGIAWERAKKRAETPSGATAARTPSRKKAARNTAARASSTRKAVRR